MTQNLYINLEDDVSKIAEKIKKIRANSLVLVCPKRCFLFNDSINLRLLKKQTDFLGKEVSILTMDEKGQLYAKEAGFNLRYLSKVQPMHEFSDIKLTRPATIKPQAQAPLAQKIAEKEKLPVKTFTPVLNEIPKVQIKDSVFYKADQDSQIEKKHKKKNQKTVFILTIMSIVLILAVIFIVLPKADIIVYPQSEPVSRDMEVSLSTQITKADVGKLSLPAQKFSETLEVNNSFQTVGKKEIGSSGKRNGKNIQLYKKTY